MAPVWDHPAVAVGIQRQEELLQSRLAAGDTLRGWKLGLGSPAAMASLGTSAPLVGFLTTQAVIPAGSCVPLDGWVKPAVEPEIAIHMKTDLAPGSSIEQAREAVAGLSPALEIVDLDVPLHDLAAVLAGDIFQRHVIVGEPDFDRAGADPTGVEVVVTKNGEQVGSTTNPEANTGRLLDLVVHVATWIGRLGHRLEASQLIIAGSVTPIIMAAPGDRVDYVCDPLGKLSVSFS